MATNFPVEDWEAIPLDTYKALLAEVKEQFDSTTEEVVSCTDKSIKCLITFVTLLFGACVFLITNHFEIHWMLYLVILILSACNVFIGYRIIRLRPSHIVGLLPANVLSVDFNSNTGFSEEEKKRLFYYNAIKTYTQKITEGINDNAKRAKKYDNFLALTLMLILAITILVFYVISYHPSSVGS